MSNDVSGFGIRVRLLASKTFPQGITLSQFTDDADPLDFPAVQIAGTAMGVNGDLIVWSMGAPLVAVLAVIPGSQDDRNLAALFEANRTGRGKFSARDVISLTALYPDGSSKTVSQGVITNGQPGKGVAAAGRLKTSPYTFAFEGLSGN